MKPRLHSLICAVAGAALFLAPVHVAPAAEPITGETGFIQYWPGDLPIVLSAPHGGRLLPKNIANRPFGKLLRDVGSLELAMELRIAMRRQFGVSPHLIVCQLARVKLDCNRELKEAAQGDPIAEKAWQEYHGFIRSAEAAVLARHPRGLYLDLHGHAHQKEQLELGYLLSREELLWPAQRLNRPDVAARSSIRLLEAFAKTDLATLLRGPQSLGGLLEQRGVPCVPSPAARLEKGDEYFDGGYSTEIHGSLDGTGLDGVQVEVPISMANDPEQRRNLARAMADALEVYFAKHYEVVLSSPQPATPPQ